MDVDWGEWGGERKKLKRRLKIQTRNVKTCVPHLMHINDHGKWGKEKAKKGKLWSEGLIKITNNSIVNEKYMRVVENWLVKLGKNYNIKESPFAF